MSLENPNVVDALGIDRETGSAILTIADSWSWDEPIEGHLLALQEKMNAYFSFIETGEIWDSYPSASGRSLVIELVTKFPIPDAAKEFLQKASLVASQIEVVVRHRTYPQQP